VKVAEATVQDEVEHCTVPKVSEVTVELGTTATDETTLKVPVVTVTDAPPAEETEAPSSPVYAINSSVFPESVLGSPSKMQMKESMIAETVKKCVS
jgi:hypothetical protein